MLSYQSHPRKGQGISIVGIGGAGAGILQCFGSSSAENVKLYTASMDERIRLSMGENVNFIQLGGGLNHGLGSGGDPEVGRRAAEASRAELESMLSETRLLVMVAGLGGGTGSGAAPVLAAMAQEKGIFLVSIVIMPFSFEGKRRRAQADKAHEEIAKLTDIMFCFENDYMEKLFSSNRGALAVFEEVDRVLAKATAAVPMLETSPGFINIGLDELATVLENADSRCIFGSGKGYGPHRAENAARGALESPLISYRGALRYARKVIVHVAGGDNMAVQELREAVETVKNALADDDVDIFFGTTVKPHLGDEVRVTLIASINEAEFKASAAAPHQPAHTEPEKHEPEPQEAPATALPETPDTTEAAPLPAPAEADTPEAQVPVADSPAPAEAEPAAPEIPQEETAMKQGELMPLPTDSATADDEEDSLECARKLFRQAEADISASPLQHHDLRSIFPPH